MRKELLFGFMRISFLIEKGINLDLLERGIGWMWKERERERERGREKKGQRLQVMTEMPERCKKICM